MLASKIFAWFVHAFTASGIIPALYAIVAISEQDFLEAFLWLMLAHFIDGVDGYDVEKKEFGKCFGTDEFIEGTTAFLEKRKANFN